MGWADNLQADREAASFRRRQRRDAHQRRQPFYYDAHGCHSRHKTHTVLAKCRWPRAMHVYGDGPFGVYVDRDHEYPSGAMAVWPDIYLYATRDEAEKMLGRMAPAARKAHVFEFPADPRDAVEYQDRTLDGIRARYAA